ncbi:MAG: bifunctional nicotinamidase/pyrazinamidase [Nitrospinae bacterium]|nr:bifunctional nicotinamidase/pyrazinamidase [Nitrospinota bacterium]
MNAIRPQPGDALIIVDVQNDFVPGGALAVPRGDEVIPVINALSRRFAQVVLTQDWHPAGHFSFASAHPGKQPFEVIPTLHGPQTLWPDHCVQGTRGAALHEGLEVTPARLLIRKGMNPALDSYSAFFENDRAAVTGLGGALRELGVRRVFIAGLATDFCVKFTALDARRLGFEALVIGDACRGIDTQGSLEVAWKEMALAGAGRVNSAEIA